MMFWRELLIGALLVAIGLVTNAYLNKRDELSEALTSHRDAVARASELRAAVESRSAEAMQRLKAEHERNLQEVERNAWINFKRRYPGFAGALCLQPQPAVSGQPEQPDAADSPSTPDAAGQGGMADFVTACARDASTIAEWQRWARLNRLPVEGE